MIARDAGWAALAATGFLMLCVFSVWGEVGGPDPDRPPGGIVQPDRHDGDHLQVAGSGKASRP